jgi:hypothetical protein
MVSLNRSVALEKQGPTKCFDMPAILEEQEAAKGSGIPNTNVQPRLLHKVGTEGSQNKSSDQLKVRERTSCETTFPTGRNTIRTFKNAFLSKILLHHDRLEAKDLDE